MKLGFGFFIIVIFALVGCSSRFNPQQTYSIQALQADYTLMRTALEEAHPGIYRYTSADSIKYILDETYRKLDMPMTEREFRKTVNPVFDYVRCGHTDIYPSNGFTRYYKKHKPKDFPFSVFYANNKLQILQNRTKDSTIKVGTEIIAINRKPINAIIGAMYQTIPSDGFNRTLKYSQVNNNFSGLLRYLYGNLDSLSVTLRDSIGKERSIQIFLKSPPKPTKKAPAGKPTPPATKPAPVPVAKTPKLNKKRNWRISERDSSIAILDINTFKDNGYRHFYRRTFRAFKRQKIKDLIIDLRSNGGGRSDASINLMSYILDEPYVVYDTIDTRVRRTSFERYYGGKALRWGSKIFFSKKLTTGGMRHRLTGKQYRPSKRLGFKGNVYLLTNGGSFSATAIFASMVNQYNPKVITIGRETGGGRFGCNAFVSPYVTLPHTEARVRLPMYKIVLHLPSYDVGRGVVPEYSVDYTFDDVRKNKDLDMEKAYELIKQKENKHKATD